jgi:predicted transposase/invertase (TIGR01784 family)
VKTDPIFYQIFLVFPGIFFELINQSPELAKVYQFSSVEVKQLSFRLDGVFLPKPSVNEPIYFVEVQFQVDPNFYSRFFSEIFLYLDKTQLKNDWRGVVIYPTRSVESYQTRRYQELLNLPRVRRIYLDEFNVTVPSMGLETIKLVVESEETAVTKAKALIGQVREEMTDATQQRDMIQLIETIIVYKFTKKSRKEIEAMLGLGDLRQTRVYQEALEEGELKGKLEGKLEGMLEGEREGMLKGKREGKLETVPLMLKLGATVEQIAKDLDLKVEDVRKAAPQNSTN